MDTVKIDKKVYWNMKELLLFVNYATYNAAYWFHRNNKKFSGSAIKEGRKLYWDLEAFNSYCDFYKVPDNIREKYTQEIYREITIELPTCLVSPSPSRGSASDELKKALEVLSDATIRVAEERMCKKIADKIAKNGYITLLDSSSRPIGGVFTPTEIEDFIYEARTPVTSVMG